MNPAAMSADESAKRRAVFGAAVLIALFLSGLVLASSWLLPYPAAVLLAAWLCAAAGMCAVFVLAVRQTRADGTDLLGAAGRSFKAL